LRVQTAAGTIHYELSGPDSAPVVTFIHGLGSSLSTWEGQAERLCGRYRVLRYDLRSHGAGEAVDEPCSRSDLAADLYRLLDALGIARTALIGHSAGGVIAMHGALEYRKRVSALVLVGTASECNDKTAAWYEETAKRAVRSGVGSAMAAMGVRSQSACPDARGFAHLARAMSSLNHDPVTEALRSLDCPTLIVVGENDFLGVGGSVILSRAIAGSRLEIVPDRGHGIHLEDPDAFAAMLTGFLGSLDLDAGT